MELATQPDTLLWGALIVLVGKIVWDWLKTRKDPPHSHRDYEKCQMKIDKLCRTLADGAHEWNAQKETLSRMDNESREVNVLLEKILQAVKNMHETMVTFLRKN